MPQGRQKQVHTGGLGIYWVKGSVPDLFWNMHSRGERGRKGRECKFQNKAHRTFDTLYKATPEEKLHLLQWIEIFTIRLLKKHDIRHNGEYQYLKVSLLQLKRSYPTPVSFTSGNNVHFYHTFMFCVRGWRHLTWLGQCQIRAWQELMDRWIWHTSEKHTFWNRILLSAEQWIKKWISILG